MSGFIRGKIECYISTKNHNYNMQQVFKNLYDFFTSHPQYTLISLNYGNTNGPANTGAGTGTNYVDSTNDNLTPAAATFGNNAFFVVRQNATQVRPYDVYHLFQWTGANNGTRGQSFGTGNGSPGLVNGLAVPINNNYGSLGHAAAIGVSGSVTASLGGTTGSLGGNPWKGGMNALTGVLGIDIKAQTGPIWGAPVGGGTGVMIFPRSNDGDTGAFRQLTQNTGGIYGGINNQSNDVRMSIIADDDSWVFWCDTGDTNAASTVLSYSGIYIPRNDMPSGSLAGIIPYCVIDSFNAMPWSVGNQSVYGDIAGTSAQQGGIIGNTTASVRPLVMDQSNAFMIDFNFHPNMQISASAGGLGGTTLAGPYSGGGFFDEYNIPVGIFEATPQQISGYLGEIDFVRTMFNVSTPGVRWDFKRAFFGDATIAQRKNSIPWDNQNRTVPRTGLTRAGITFIRPGPA